MKQAQIHDPVEHDNDQQDLFTQRQKQHLERRRSACSTKNVCSSDNSSTTDFLLPTLLASSKYLNPTSERYCHGTRIAIWWVKRLS